MRQARVLAQATSDLVNAMRSDAEAEVDVDNSKKLLAAAKLLADATARMVEAAKVELYIFFIYFIIKCAKLFQIREGWDSEWGMRYFLLIHCIPHCIPIKRKNTT